jgi:hypothetical protein
VPCQTHHARGDLGFQHCHVIMGRSWAVLFLLLYLTTIKLSGWLGLLKVAVPSSDQVLSHLAGPDDLVSTSARLSSMVATMGVLAPVGGFV